MIVYKRILSVLALMVPFVLVEVSYARGPGGGYGGGAGGGSGSGAGGGSSSGYVAQTNYNILNETEVDIPIIDNDTGNTVNTISAGRSLQWRYAESEKCSGTTEGIIESYSLEDDEHKIAFECDGSENLLLKAYDSNDDEVTVWDYEAGGNLYNVQLVDNDITISGPEDAAEVLTLENEFGTFWVYPENSDNLLLSNGYQYELSYEEPYSQCEGEEAGHALESYYSGSKTDDLIFKIVCTGIDSVGGANVAFAAGDVSHYINPGNTDGKGVEISISDDGATLTFTHNEDYDDPWEEIRIYNKGNNDAYLKHVYSDIYGGSSSTSRLDKDDGYYTPSFYSPYYTCLEQDAGTVLYSVQNSNGDKLLDVVCDNTDDKDGNNLRVDMKVEYGSSFASVSSNNGNHDFTVTTEGSDDYLLVIKLE